MGADRGAADPAGRPPLGALARAWRERALLTQEQLAERSGLGLRTVRRLEATGECRFRGRSILLLADALGLSADERARMAEAAGTGRRPPADPDSVTCQLAAALRDQSLRLADLGRSAEALAAIEEAV